MSWLVRLYVGAIIVGLGGILAGCDLAFEPQLQGSGMEKTETRAVGAFTEVEVGHAIELEVTIGPAADVVVTADDNLLPHLHTDVSGSCLRISSDRNYSSNIGVKVLVSVPELNTIVGTGAARISAAAINGPEFHLDLSGASHCEIAAETKTMHVMLSGASNASFSGSTEKFTIDCSGASRLNARQFSAESVEADLSGASFAEVHADREIKAEAAGASNLRYKGGAQQIYEHTTGASTVDRDSTTSPSTY